jgi:hypothetical protein
MKVLLLAVLGLFVLVDANTSLRAQPSEKKTWRLEVEAGEGRLEYGTDTWKTPRLYSLARRPEASSTSTSTRPAQA